MQICKLRTSLFGNVFLLIASASSDSARSLKRVENKRHFVLLEAMKTRLFTIWLAAVCAAASARIGDTKQEISDRLFGKTPHAYVYNSREDRLREALELPYKHKILMFPAGAENFFVFKNPTSGTTAQGDTITQHELYGWELHIVFYRGKSVLEFYRRHTDPMTMEELAELMEIAPQSKTKSKWRFVPEIFINKQWVYNFKNGAVENKTLRGTSLKEILPPAPNKFVYVEVPEAIKNDGAYKTSLVFDMLTIEGRKANETYRNYVEKNVKQKAAKTAKSKTVKKTAPAKINAFAERVFRLTTQAFYDPQSGAMSVLEYYIPDVYIGGRAPVRYDKTIQITVNVPRQAGTAFGYTYQTEDKSVRALLYTNAVLFVDSEFDKQLREYIDGLYVKQQKIREDEAKESVANF